MPSVKNGGRKVGVLLVNAQIEKTIFTPFASRKFDLGVSTSGVFVQQDTIKFLVEPYR
jgi:hypothetical protein